MNNKWRDFLNDEEPKYEYDPNLSLISEDNFEDLEDYSEILSEAEDLLDEKKRKKRKKKKKKKKGKKDACYHKVRARYDVWPSAYASGALVKCRKVGAANWGNKSKKTNEELELDEDLLEQIVEEEIEETIDEKKRKKKRKLTSKPSSERSLRDWFGRRGAKGGKKAIAQAVNRKRRKDSNANRKGKAKNVSNKYKK